MFFWLRRSVALPHRHSDLLSLSYPTKTEILEERCGINCIFLHLSLYRKSTVLRFFGSHFPCFSFVKGRKNPPEKSGGNEKNNEYWGIHPKTVRKIGNIVGESPGTQEKSRLSAAFLFFVSYQPPSRRLYGLIFCELYIFCILCSL